jgi:hypothetical protein
MTEQEKEEHDRISKDEQTAIHIEWPEEETEDDEAWRLT